MHIHPCILELSQLFFFRPGLRRTGRPGTGRSSSPPSWGTSEDENVRDANKDGDEDVRGRHIKFFDGTSEDEDVQDED